VVRPAALVTDLSELEAVILGERVMERPQDARVWAQWLLLSLEDHYAALRGKPAESRDGGRNEAEWSTTPQNYLEKIFQIPFTLRPMEASGFHSLVESLLPVAATSEDTNDDDGNTAGNRTPGAGESDGSGSGSQSTEKVDEESLHAGETGPNEDVEEEDDEADTDEGTGTEAGSEPRSLRLRPNPQGLTVEEREREFIRMLHPLIVSPRALKRFTNVYRFLRVQQRGPDLDRFRGTSGKPGEFQVAALLLAAVVGYPAEATSLLRAVLTRRDKAWWELVEALDTSGAEQDAALRAEADAHGAERQRATLREALQEVRSGIQLADHPPETFAWWAREVARFSFQSGRILSFREHEPSAAEVA